MVGDNFEVASLRKRTKEWHFDGFFFTLTYDLEMLRLHRTFIRAHYLISKWNFLSVIQARLSQWVMIYGL